MVLEPLGEGSQGRTFDGFDRLEGRPVAIKRFDVRGAKAWKDVELAEREARVLESLDHPQLPGYVEHFEQDGALFLVMQKIEGETVAVRAARGSLSEAEILRMLRDLGEVLDYLHGRATPVIHRDIKPGNVIRRPDGSFVLVDFGAVRDKLKPQGGSTVVGTFGFMAPEQFQGRALPASDVYATGATALALLTGRQPEDLPHQGLAIDVRAALRGVASPALTRTLEAMLVPDPDRRASTIGPLLGRGGSAPPSERSSRPGWQVEREARQFADREGRRAERHARRAAWRQARAERRAMGRGGPRSAWRGPFAILFAIAMLGVSIATQAVVPIVLTIVSIFVARSAMRRAASSVQTAGREALDRMDRIRAGEAEPGEAPDAARPRGAGEPPRARVLDSEDEESEELEARRRRVL